MQTDYKEHRISRLLMIKNKIITEEGVYHITQRAPGKEILFLENSDYLYFLHLLKEVSSTFRLNVFSFALMPNHVHILLQIKENNLPKAMKQIFQKYAFYFNKKYERKGHVFCGVYRAAWVNSEPYLLAASLYIHLNPFKAGLCKEVREYRWSSILLYTDINESSFVNYRVILEMLDDDIDKARGLYKDFLINSSGIEYENILEEPKALSNFNDRLLKIFANNIFKLKDRQGNLSSFLELEKKIEFFRNKMEKKNLTKPRDVQAVRYMVEQLKSRGYKVVDIAGKLNINRSTVYRICNTSFRKESVAKLGGIDEFS